MSAGKGIVLTVTVAAIAAAQTPARPAFEVASIRPSTNSDSIQGGKVAVGVHIDGAQVRVVAFTLKDYLGIAYRMKIAQISGPDWIGSDRFDISATIPAGGKASEIDEMFQSLLAERFQLKFHREKKEFPVYALVEGKGPLKLKEEPPDPGDANTSSPVDIKGGGSVDGVNINYGNGSTFTFVPNTIEVHKLPMEQFAGIIERFADRTVVDMTGLKGRYDFKVDINADDYLPMLIHSAINAGVSLPPEAAKLAEGHTATGLSDALQQVGLKLDPRRAPLDVIVVDDARRTPTEN
jgi:uncharacterized protein (TIGR03435 family)